MWGSGGCCWQVVWERVGAQGAQAHSACPHWAAGQESRVPHLLPQHLSLCPSIDKGTHLEKQSWTVCMLSLFLLPFSGTAAFSGAHMSMGRPFRSKVTFPNSPGISSSLGLLPHRHALRPAQARVQPSERLRKVFHKCTPHTSFMKASNLGTGLPANTRGRSDTKLLSVLRHHHYLKNNRTVSSKSYTCCKECPRCVWKQSA